MKNTFLFRSTFDLPNKGISYHFVSHFARMTSTVAFHSNCAGCGVEFETSSSLVTITKPDTGKSMFYHSQCFRCRGGDVCRKNGTFDFRPDSERSTSGFSVVMQSNACPKF